MKRFPIFFLLMTLVVFGCNKDEFPDQFSIIGPWLEKTTDSLKTEIEFKSSNRAYLRLSPEQAWDTLRYKLDKKDELQLFLPEDYPNGNHSNHQISYSSRTEELVIYGLVPSIPESTSRKVFKRK